MCAGKVVERRCVVPCYDPTMRTVKASSVRIGVPPNSAKVIRAFDRAALLQRVEDGRELAGLTLKGSQANVGARVPHATYHRQLNVVREFGWRGLVDRRGAPPPKVSDRIVGFLEGTARVDPQVSTAAMRQAVAKGFSVSVSVRTVQAKLQAAGLSRSRNRFPKKDDPGPLSPTTPQTAPADESGVIEELDGAGLALLTLASEKIGYAQEMAQVIKEVAEALPEPVIPLGVDRSNRDEKGRFLPEYNAPRPRSDPQVGAVFESVDFKEMDKDLRRLSIVETSCETIAKKVMALVALPVVSEKGRFDGVTDPRGEWLRSLGGPAYAPETLAKFARELKYGRLSTPLMERHANLWHRQLSPALGEEASALILYADGTVKPLWTELLSRSGKVTMLGRIMPCLESILIHTGAGVPLYLKTFAGGASLVTNLLPAIHEMEAAIGKGMLGRLTVIDAGGASVAFFKELDRELRRFITPLPQVKDISQVKELTPLGPYRNGDSVGGGWVYLRDSNDPKAPLYKLRAVVLKRRTKETIAVYGSSATPDEFSNVQLMDAYFGRWPAQELVFRDLNGGVSFKTVHGYGKQRVLNVTVIDEITKLSAQIENATRRLEKVREERDESARTLQALEVAKQELRGQKLPEDETACGRRQATVRTQSAQEKKSKLTPMEQMERENNRLKTQLVRAKHKERESKVQRLEAQIEHKEQEKTQLEARREIYLFDVELDQIISVFKMGCALLVQALLFLYFGGQAIEFNTFVRHILALPGTRILTDRTETIRFRANRRDPEMMALLEQACERINATNHQRNGRAVRFEVSWSTTKSRHAT